MGNLDNLRDMGMATQPLYRDAAKGACAKVIAGVTAFMLEDESDAIQDLMLELGHEYANMALEVKRIVENNQRAIEMTTKRTGGQPKDMTLYDTVIPTLELGYALRAMDEIKLQDLMKATKTQE